MLRHVHFILLYIILYTGVRLIAIPLLAGLVLAAVPLLLVGIPIFYGCVILDDYLIRRSIRKKREMLERENRELGDPLVFKRYSARHVYKMGNKEIEVAYP